MQSQANLTYADYDVPIARTSDFMAAPISNCVFLGMARRLNLRRITYTGKVWRLGVDKQSCICGYEEGRNDINRGFAGSIIQYSSIKFHGPFPRYLTTSIRIPKNWPVLVL